MLRGRPDGLVSGRSAPDALDPHRWKRHVMDGLLAARGPNPGSHRGTARRWGRRPGGLRDEFSRFLCFDSNKIGWSFQSFEEFFV